MKSDYPRLQDVYTHEQLCEHFSLAMPERQFVQTFRGTANQQAIAILLKVLPHLGYFPRSLHQVPVQVRGFIAEQLGHAQDESCRYTWQSRTRERHMATIRSFIGWRAATGQAGVGSLAAARRRLLRADVREAVRTRRPTPPPSAD